MNLLEQMGLDPDTFTWHDLAACDGVEEPDIFYDKYESDKTLAKQVDQMCIHCPVAKQCAETAMKNKEVGVWGGVYWNGSGRADESKNDHKTPEVWEQIAEIMQ